MLHGLGISRTATFDIGIITMPNDISIFYPSELLKHDRQGRRRNKFISKKFEKSKLCSMDASNEHVKRRAGYNITHTNFFYRSKPL